MTPDLLKTRTKSLSAVILLIGLLLTGCTAILDGVFNNALPEMEGTLAIKGLSEKVTVRRNSLGIPMITAETLDDLVFAQGFTSACDRFTQMAGFRMAAQGRLSEIAGPAALDVDLFLRAMNINEAARIIYETSSEDLRRLLQLYSDGVNAYLDMYRDRLPRTLTLSGYRPEKWQPRDCASVFILITLGLAQNLHEEIDILNLVRVLGPEKTAWLTPIYPDEAIPFDEYRKLEQVDITGAAADLNKLASVASQIGRLGFSSPAASNNWVVSGTRTRSGHPIFANDTHLPLAMPAIWHLMHLRCPGLEGAGICLAGVPGIVAGYNGKVACGMTMVMADNQDIFLEQLKKENDVLHYLYQGEWFPAITRTESFRIRGADTVTRAIHETRHGVLLNDILTDRPRNELVPNPATGISLGIAVQWAAFSPDQSMEAFFNIMKATSVQEALASAKKIQAIPLNLVLADKKDIAWQVTGRYPIRKKGRGLCPSPGWTGEYDWQGFIDPADHPFVVNPEEGFRGTANHRIVPANHPQVLSSSWYYPDRAARIHQLLEENREYTFEDARRMQLDLYSPFMTLVKQRLLCDEAVQEAISNWPDKNKRLRAGRGLNALTHFEGEMTVDSPGAAFCGAFLHCLPENLFADELGGTDTVAWQSLLDTFLLDYSALHDHLAPRCANSPFWDNVNTSEKESRAAILAETVHDTALLLENQCGKNPAEWRWGDLHTYHWKTEGTKLADHMGLLDRMGLKLLSAYLDRGPYPAPGDHSTLNVAGYYPGSSFDVWLIPAMRIIVDFGQAEPLYAINSSGQSDHPASPHYDDGIKAWLAGEYLHLPLSDKKTIEETYTRTLVLRPE